MGGSLSDIRFTENKIFKFHAYNMTMRRQILQTSRRFLADHDLFNVMTVESVISQAAVGDISVIQKLRRYCKQVEGSPQFKFNQRQHLLAMVKTLGIPKFFVTLSVADNLWPTIQPNPNASFRERNQYVNTHSTKIVHVFIQKATLILEEMRPDLNIFDTFTMFEFQGRGSIHLHALWWADLSGNDDNDYHLKVKYLTEAS